MADLTSDALIEAGWNLAAGYTLRPLLSRSRQAAGIHTGNEPGASLEFHEYRPYQPGDDLRRVDWGVYGRSDLLVVRQYQVELSPNVEIHLDGSASMGLYPGKSAAALFLASFLAGVIEGAEGHPVLVLGEERHLREGILGALKGCPFSAREELGASGRGSPCRGRPVRILISDFLFEDAARVMARLGQGADLLLPFVLLAEEERNPTLRGPVRLVDAETTAKAVDLLANRQAVDRYRARLDAHLDALDGACRRTRGELRRFHVKNRYRTLDEVTREVLDHCLRAGMVAPS